MKKIALLIALVMLQVQLSAVAVENANYKKKPAQKTQATKSVSNIQTSQQVKPADNDDYLLKYNINDLEAAPWLNGGKRKI